ncbi:MAG: hypothetical protein QOE96_828 [Blastocatellia bacterium]|jgi:hypothetical protein|nr:hypothetical protein [Blastocatellia bacterium]
MNKFRFTIKIFAIAIFMFAFASLAQAQATRTWVSGVGDDANPCSRTAPCKTFAGAISKTAPGGEIDCIDPGGFGAVTITKSITIDGGGTFGSILGAGTNAININAGTSDVIQLRNLSINGATTGLTGINITAALQVFIENCVIFGFRAGAGKGVNDVRTTPNARLYLLDTTIKNNSTNGINVGIDIGAVTTVAATLDNCRLVGNTLSGIFAGGGSRLTIRHSTITGNGNAGVQVSQQSGGTAEAAIMSSVISHNSTGIFAGSGASITRISDVTMTNNTSAGTSFSGGTIESFGNNNIRGNGGGLPGNGQGIANVGPQ